MLATSASVRALCCLGLGLAGACSSSPRSSARHPQPVPPLDRSWAEASAARLVTPLPGPLATGRRGDFLLRDRHLAVVVRGLDGPHAGSLIDAAALRRPDGLGALTPMLGAGRRVAPPLYKRLFFARDALGRAGIRLTGSDRRHPRVAVEVHYLLRDDGTIGVLTAVTNRSDQPLTGYRLCDRIDWGNATGWAPGFGFLPREQIHADWLGGLGGSASYAYQIDHERLAASFDSDGVAEVELRRLPTLDPGESVRVERSLAVAPGGQLGLALTRLLQRSSVSPVQMAIISQSREPVVQAQIEIRRSGRPYARLVSGDDGRAAISLPADDYRVRAIGGGQSTGWHPLRAPRRSGVLRLRTGPPSQLVFEVRQQDKVTGPARLTIEGIEDTPSPWLGPPHSAAAGNMLLTSSGTGVIALPPGRYRVTASRGPLFNVAVKEVVLRPFEGASFVARIAPIPSAGFVAVDLAQDVVGDENCSVRPQTRSLSNGAEGIAIAGLSSAAAPLRRSLLAVELNSLSAGKKAFVEWAPPAPNAEESPPPKVDGMRVLDGRFPAAFDQRLQRWLALLASGRRLVATAASASRLLWRRPPTYPRTYVLSKSATPASLLDQLGRGAAVISTGPIVRLSVGGKGPGELLAARPRRGRKRRPLEVDVQVTVLAPDWVPASHLELLVNGARAGKPLPISSTGASGVRLRQKLSLRLQHDAFVVAVVRSSGTLNAIGVALPSLAITNPVWVDVDGDGKLLFPRSSPANQR